MEQKYKALIYSTYKDVYFEKKMEFTQHDSKTAKILFECYDDINVPMTDIQYAVLNIHRPDGKSYTFGMSYDDNPVFEITNNNVLLILPPAALYVAGKKYEGSIALHGTDGKRLTVTRFTYDVIEDMTSDTPIDETNEFPILTELIDDVTILKDAYKGALDNSAYGEVIAARKGEKLLGDRLDKLDDRLDEFDSSLSNATSDISILQGQIVTKVSQTEIDNSIKAITIGGRNLLTGTKDELTYVNVSGWADYRDNNTNHTDLVNILQPGETYTLRVFLDARNSDYPVSVRIRLPNKTNPIRDFGGSWIEAGKQGYSTVTFVMPDDATGSIVFMIRFNQSNTPTQNVGYGKAKLEKGNTATDWTPAPEDIQNQLDEHNTKISTAESSITQLTNSITDLKGYIGYTENDIVGVEADFVNKKFTRLAGAVGKTPGADFDSIKAFGGRKRCILTDCGVVLAYYGESGYVETGQLTQKIRIGEEENTVFYPAGMLVQVMVEQPKFYYKVVPLELEKIQDGIGYHLRKARYYVSDTPKVGFKVHPAFVRNGVEVDKIYLSAYEGSIYDASAGTFADRTYLLADEQIADFNKAILSSIANAKPASGLTQNLTRANARELANTRGDGWQLSDVLSVSATQMLMMIEYAAFNMQSAIGLGVVNKANGEGNESEITGATTNLGNASGMAAGTNGLVSISYRGEENFWGNINKWIDGLNIYIDLHTRKTDAYWAAEDFSDNTGSAPYKHVGFNLAPNTDGYISAFGYSEECDFLFLPTETLGNSALPVGDRFYNTQTGWRFALLGGHWYNSSDTGAFGWYVSSSGSRHRAVGGRLVYVPQ